MEERLGGHHGTLQAVLLQRVLNPLHDRRLLIFTERLTRNHVRVVRTPVADADLAVFADDVFKTDGLARRRVE